MNADVSPEPKPDDSILGTAFIGFLIVFAILGLGGYLGYRFLQPPPAPLPPAPKPAVLPAPARALAFELPDLPFADITEQAGIQFVHENGAVGEKLLPETMGGGCAFFDYDRDGDADLLLINSRNWPTSPGAGERTTHRLYANDGKGKFTDVTAAAGLNLSMYGMGVACGDYNADGWVDLFISCLGPDHLLRNDRGKFVDVTASAGVGGEEQAWSTACGWFDYDRDGDLDLFVAHYVQWTRESDIAHEFQLLGGGSAYGRPQNFEGTFPSLFRNDGSGKFTDVSESAGLHVLNPATKTPLAKSLGVIFEDFDSDGDPDILVANDTVQNFLFVNQGNGTFIEAAALAGVAFDLQGAARGAMGIDSGRFRNDPCIGVAIGNFANEMTALYVTCNNNLLFYDEAISNGLGPATRRLLTFGILLLDVDLDGRLDLFQANGHLEEDISKVQSSQTYEQPPQLFWNAGPQQHTEFALMPDEKLGPQFSVPMVGRGASSADIDGDGDLDLLITTTGQKPRLLRNDQQTGHHWLRVKLEGAGQNRDAIGAVVTLTAGKLMLQRTVSPTRSYLSQVELPVTFGLGDLDAIEKIQIRWPNGQEQTLNNVKPDRLLVVKQAG